MRSFLSSILAFLAIGTVLTPETASALEIFANGGVGNAGVTIGSETAISTGLAQGFTVGPTNTNNLLTSITLALETNPLQTNLDKLVFALYSSSASLPNAEIARFASVPNGGWGTGVAAEYTFNFASGTQELSLNTSYWIVATYENLTYTHDLDAGHELARLESWSASFREKRCGHRLPGHRQQGPWLRRLVDQPRQQVPEHPCQRRA
jgi:hypothetical protein